MAVVVFTNANKFSFPSGDWAQIADGGHLAVYKGGTSAKSVVGIFPPGGWTEYVVSGEASAKIAGKYQTISVEVTE